MLCSYNCSSRYRHELMIRILHPSHTIYLFIRRPYKRRSAALQFMVEQVCDGRQWIPLACLLWRVNMDECLCKSDIPAKKETDYGSIKVTVRTVSEVYPSVMRHV